MTGTYVYALVVNGAKPRVARSLRRLPHGGPVRLVPVERGRWLVAASVPLEHYGEKVLASGLSDLDWVSGIAVAHEAVVEAFLACEAVLPMKLFTIFGTDERAVENIASRRAGIEQVIARVRRREEWGIRIALGRKPAAASRASAAARSATPTGSHYLLHKKAQRDEIANRALRAKTVATELFDALAAHAADARKRPATELAPGGGSLILDAALLVPRTRSARLKAAAAKQARALAAEGYDVTLTGPWPPYSFMQD